MKAIITFHSIDDHNTVLSYSPSMFEALIGGILNSGITICTLDQLVLPETDNAVAITFDDGMRSVYQSALPVLKDANVPAHLYLTTGYVGKTNRWPTQPELAPNFDMMNWNEVDECFKGGIHIENHTVTHPNLCNLTPQEIEEECINADECIEQHFGYQPKHFAYPYGFFDKKVSEITSKRYKSCVTTVLKPVQSSHKNEELPRLDSYYLQKPWLHKNLFSPAATGYLASRYIMRTARSKLLR